MKKSIEFLEFTAADRITNEIGKNASMIVVYTSNPVIGKDIKNAYLFNQLFILINKTPKQVNCPETVINKIDEDAYYIGVLGGNSNHIIDFISFDLSKIAPPKPVEEVKDPEPIFETNIPIEPAVLKDAYEEVERDRITSVNNITRNVTKSKITYEKIFNENNHYFYEPLKKINDSENKTKTVIMNGDHSFSKVFDYALIKGDKMKYRIIVNDYKTKIEFDKVDDLKKLYPDAIKTIKKNSIDYEYLYIYLPDEIRNLFNSNSMNIKINLIGLEETLRSFQVKQLLNKL